MQLGMVLRVHGICDLDLRKKGQNALTEWYYKKVNTVFRFQYTDDLK